MKIFITGSTGFVGRNLIEYYAEHNLFQYKRNEDLIECLIKFDPDVIINAAAEIYNDDFMWNSNVILTKNCLDYVKSNPRVKMIQIGSSSEYGIMNTASKETDRIDPVDMYQSTKGIATILCQGYARTYDLDICIARPYSLYGKYEQQHRLFPNLWKAFIKNIPMTLYDGVHDFIFIDDFVRGIDILIKSDKNKTKGDIINFGSGVQYKNIEILNMFETVLQKQAPIQYVPHMKKRFEGGVWKCDTEYSRNKYQFKCHYDLNSGVVKFIETAKY